MATPPIDVPFTLSFFDTAEDDFWDRATPRFSNLDFTPAVQQQIVDDCDALSANAVIVPNGERYCLLNELRDDNPAAFPYATESALAAALAAFYSSSRYATLSSQYQSYSSYTGFLGSSSSITALFQSFNTTVPFPIVFTSANLKPYYRDWTAAIDATCTDTAPCLFTGVQPMWLFMAMLRDLQTSMVINIILALVVSYVMLVLTTGNLLVPLLGIVSIGGTILWTSAVNFLSGNKLDAYFAILVTLCVGLSVDYAVHLVHFYNEAGGSRYEKAQAAYHGVGISIVGGCVTTAGAAIPLMLAQHTMFFRMAGQFIIATAFFGLLFTFFMLGPMLMAFGPSGDTGDVRAIVAKLTGRSRVAPQ